MGINMGKLYTIHQVAELLGISTDAIRLYEKEKLIQPERNPDNGYRYYNFEQLQRVMGIYLYRQLGVGISGIRELIKHQTFEGVEAQFDSFIESSEKEILRLQRRLEKMKFMKRHLENVKEGLNFPCIRQMENCYILYHQDFPDLQYSYMKQILSSPIFSYGNMCFEIEEEKPGSYKSKNMEFIVRNSMLDLTPWKSNTEVLPVWESCECVYMVVETTEAKVMNWNLQRMQEFAEEKHMKCASRGYGFYVFSIVNQDVIKNYFEIYLPIEKKY